MPDDDSITVRVRYYSNIERESFARYAFKVGESGGIPVIGQVWLLGSRGSMARVDGGDPGDEDVRRE